MNTFISFDGTQIAYHNEGEGRAIILLHGFGFDGLAHFGPFERTLPLLVKMRELCAEVFGVYPPLPHPPFDGRRGLMNALRQAGASVIVPDMRGFGSSAKPVHASAYSNGAMARDVIALIDHLKLGAVDVVGVSMGAVVALRLLALQPAKVKSAVLSGIGDYVIEGMPLNIAFPLPDHVPVPLTQRAWAEEGARILDHGQIVPGHPACSYLLAARAMQTDPKVWAAALRGAVAEVVTAQELQQIQVPVLILNGRNDTANQDVRVLCNQIASAITQHSEGDHHSTPYEPTFQEAVISFLDRQ